MTKPFREFQVFVKPVGAVCNLRCHYCYYLDKEDLYRQKRQSHPFRMSVTLLETYIFQHIKATPGQVINFSWHGGEPALAGIDFFKKVVELQNKYKPHNKKIINGIQTNGTLLDDKWCRFLSDKDFIVGISIDGPEKYHNMYRVSSDREPSFKSVMAAYNRIQQYNIVNEVLCVVHAGNVGFPEEVYGFFRRLGAKYMTFLPLVYKMSGSPEAVTVQSVPAESFGDFMISVFDEWVNNDIGKVKVQLFEEAARAAFNQDHTICIFKESCGGVPVVEHNGDFFSCDHYVDREHLLGNINDKPLSELLNSKRQHDFGMAKLKTLPRFCLDCEVLTMCNGECPRNRFILTPAGEPGLNYLCRGYRKFFNHCKPWVNAVSEIWKRQNTLNRNSLCPCGSGKKYKHCCIKN